MKEILDCDFPAPGRSGCRRRATRQKAAEVPTTAGEPQPHINVPHQGAYRMEATMSTMLVLEGAAILGIIVLFIHANWRRLTKDPQEEAP